MSFSTTLKNSGRGLASRRAARHRRAQSPPVGVVYGNLLARERHDRHDRFTCTARSRRLADALGTLPTFRRVCGRSQGQPHQRSRGREGDDRQRPASLDRLSRSCCREPMCHACSGSSTARSPPDGATNDPERGWFPLLNPRSINSCRAETFRRHCGYPRSIEASQLSGDPISVENRLTDYFPRLEARGRSEYVTAEVNLPNEGLMSKLAAARRSTWTSSERW